MDLNDLRDHYRINDCIFEKLAKEITLTDLIKSIPLFHGTWERKINPLGLCYYIDDHGDFNVGDEPHKKIARAIFQSMEARDKVELMMYLEWYHNGDEEDEDDAAEDEDDF